VEEGWKEGGVANDFSVVATIVDAFAGVLQKNGKHFLSFRSETPASISGLAQRPHNPDLIIHISISSDLAVALVEIIMQRKKVRWQLLIEL
jgi:hypothetical protein